MLPILPPAPSRTDPSNFSSKADAWVDALADWTDAANALEQSLQLVATIGTSTSSLGIGTGSKGLTTQTGKAWGVGSWVYLASASSITNLMQGQVTAYNSGTGNLVVNVTQSTGSGTYTDWVIALASPTTNSANLSGGVAGSIPYQSGVNTTAMLSPSTAGKILVCNAGAAPSWQDNSRLLNIQAFGGGTFTYTATSGTRRRLIKIRGGGGGSSGMPATTGSQIAFNQPGNTGGLAELDSTYDWDGATIVVGAAGSAGASGADGGNGGLSSITKGSYFVSVGGGVGGALDSVRGTFPARVTITNTGTTPITSSPDTLTRITKQLAGAYPDEPVALTISSGYLPKAPSLSEAFSNNRWFATLSASSVAIGASSGNAGEGGAYAVSGPSSPARGGYAGQSGLIEIYEYA